MKIKRLSTTFALLAILSPGIDAALSVERLGTGVVSSESITSLEQADALVRATQKQFWLLFPPSDDWLYVHSEKSIRPVIWSSAWPNELKKQMYAEMRSINGNLYPVYTLWAEADRVTGDLTYYNMYGLPVWTSQAPLGYTPLSPVLERYGVDQADDLTEAQQKFSASSIGLELHLLPSAFLESYEQDIVMEQQSALLSTESMAMSTLSVPMPGDEGTTGTNYNPTGEGSYAGMSYPEGSLLILPHLSGTFENDWLGLTNTVSGQEYEFYFTYNLIYLPFSTNGSPYDMARLAKRDLQASGDVLYWDAPIMGENGLNQSVGFFRAFSVVDSDGDGLSDAYEIMMTGTSPTNSHTGGSALSDAEKDQDSDGLTNLEEYQGMANNVYTDPAMPDSDYDGKADNIDPWPMDYAGKEDTDRDRMPDELNGTSTSYPMLVADNDDDNDGFSDTNETTMGSNPLDASSPGNSAFVDSDGDGLYDWQDPYPDNPDGDGDGIGDGYEVKVLENSATTPNSYTQGEKDTYNAMAGDADTDSRPLWVESSDSTNPNDGLDFKVNIF